MCTLLALGAVLPRRSLLAAPLAAALSPAAAPAAPAPASGALVIDGASRFSLTVPRGFVASKRSASQGTLYVAGDFPRAAVVSVTAWPVSELLAAEAAARSLPGLPAVASGAGASPAALADIAPPEELARILARARDREQGGGLSSEVTAAAPDGAGRLVLSLSTELPVANPDELERQRGIRRLVRRTAGTVSLGSVPSPAGGAPVAAVVAAWASCLAEDWDGQLGPQLRDAADSFRWGEPAAAAVASSN